MKTILNILSIILLTYSLQSCSFTAVKGNGNVVEKEVAISDYNAIEFSGGASMVYEQNNEAAPYFRVEIDENLYPLLIIESKNGTLSIRSKENLNPTKYNIYTNSTGLEKLNASGSIKVHLKGDLMTDNLYMDASGSVKVQADNINCISIKSRISGSGDFILTGKAKQLDCSISGSGKVKAESMIADSVYCKVSGSGNFEVYAVEYLNVGISGSGSVKYKGEPKVDQSISGSGKIVRAE